MRRTGEEDRKHRSNGGGAEDATMRRHCCWVVMMVLAAGMLSFNPERALGAPQREGERWSGGGGDRGGRYYSLLGCYVEGLDATTLASMVERRCAE